MNLMYLNEKQVSKLTGFSLGKLRSDRHLRKGLPYCKLSSRMVRYRLEDIEAFMNDRLISFTDDERLGRAS